MFTVTRFIVQYLGSFPLLHYIYFTITGQNIFATPRLVISRSYCCNIKTFTTMQKVLVVEVKCCLIEVNGVSTL